MHVCIVFAHPSARSFSRAVLEAFARGLREAGHDWEETGIAEAMRRILLNDRLLGVGVRAADLEILGGMMPGDDAWRERNLRRAYELGRDF